MDDFKSNVPSIMDYTRRSKPDWNPTAGDEGIVPEEGRIKTKDGIQGQGQSPDMGNINKLLNPSGDVADNPYDFGSMLGDM